MHFHFDFSTVQVLWTLTFAGLLVVLVVLLGRDRAQRFPWFTTSIVLMALRLLASRMLFGRLSHQALDTIFLSLADAAVATSLLVLVELSRRAFVGARRGAATAVTLGVLAVGAAVTGLWGPWPNWKTLAAAGPMAKLLLMQMVAQKGEMLTDTLTVVLGLLVVLLGWRFKAGWRSHTQQIVIGLSAASLAQLGLRASLQALVQHAVIRSQAQYEHILGMREKLYNANNIVYLVVLVWWIACLWIDEPGTGTNGAAAAMQPAQTVDAGAEEPPAAE